MYPGIFPPQPHEEIDRQPEVCSCDIREGSDFKIDEDRPGDSSAAFSRSNLSLVVWWKDERVAVLLVLALLTVRKHVALVAEGDAGSITAGELSTKGTLGQTQLY